MQVRCTFFCYPFMNWNTSIWAWAIPQSTRRMLRRARQYLYIQPPVNRTTISSDLRTGLASGRSIDRLLRVTFSCDSPWSSRPPCYLHALRYASLHQARLIATEMHLQGRQSCYLPSHWHFWETFWSTSVPEFRCRFSIQKEVISWICAFGRQPSAAALRHTFYV